MITFSIQEQDIYNEEGFITKFPGDIYRFEFTLNSLKKWERIYQKIWFSKEPKTRNEMMYMFKCMNVDLDKEIFPELLSSEQVTSLEKYLDNPMGAHRLPKKNDLEKATKIRTQQVQNIVYSYEVIVSFCILNRIDLEWAEKQNLNQLMTILGVLDALQSEPQKMDPKKSFEEMSKINKERLAKLKTEG